MEQHQALVTITVDGYQDGSGTSSPVQYPANYWHLPNIDPRSEGRSLSKLHTLDVYFWTVQDANSFTAILQKLLSQQQLNLPLMPTPQDQAMSKVVQQLENVAVQDSASRAGQARNSSSVISSSNPPASAPVPGEIPKTSNSDRSTTYQLLAYNPASPPAPEKIAHREKTPPPQEAETGTGLAAAAYRDQSHSQFSPIPQPPNAASQAALVPKPGQYGYNITPAGSAHSSSYIPPPPPPGYVSGSPQTYQSRNPSVSSSPYVPTSNPSNSGGGYASPALGYGGLQAPYAAPNKISFDPPPKDSNAYVHGSGTRPPDSPATEILGNSYISGQPALQHLQPQYADYLASQRRPEYPEGSYSSYQYDQPQHHQTHHSHSNKHNVHDEFYQPTEAEAHKHKHQRPAGGASSKVEKGIGRLLKKVEKTIG